MRPHNYGPAVDPKTREIRYLSPSQITQADEGSEGGCLRKWYFAKVLGKKADQTTSQELGDVVHWLMEHWLRGQPTPAPTPTALIDAFWRGREPPPPAWLEERTALYWRALKIVEHGRHIAPTPGPDLLIETSVEVWEDADRYWSPVRAADVPIIGRIDLAHARDPARPEIGDHKTSSDKRYMKRPNELGTNVQMLTYGMWAGCMWPTAEAVTLAHYYYGTRSRWAERVAVSVNLQTVKERWYTSITPIVVKMKQAARLPVLEEVPANLSACSAYGGCPYRSECVTDPFEVLTMSLFNKRPAPAMQTPEGMKYTPQQQVHFGVDEDGTPKKLLVEDHTNSQSISDTIAPRATGVLPPDAPAPDPVLSAAGEVGQIHQSATGTRRWDGSQWVLYTPPAASAAAPVGYPTEAPAKRGRGRPKKIQDTSATGANVSQTNVPPVASGEPKPITAAPAAAPGTGDAPIQAPPAPPEAAQGGTSTTPPAGGSFILIIDAIPTGQYVLLDAYIDEIHRQVCKAARAIDFAAIDYGKGPGMLRAAAAANPPPPGCYVVFTSDLSAPVIEALVPKAGAVIRGVARR